MKGSQRFKGLKLSAADRRELRRRSGAGTQRTARIWRRIQVLQMLDRGLTLSATASALGTYGREVSRVARRYLAKGLVNDEYIARMEDVLRVYARPFN